MNRAELHQAIRHHRPTCDLPIEDAMRVAFDCIARDYERNPDPDKLSALTWLWDIRIQAGCEHLDTGRNNTGRLLDAISVIIRG